MSRLYWGCGLCGHPLIHAVGDSHTKAFSWVMGCVVHHFGGATAYQLGNPESSTRSRDKLFKLINRLDSSRNVLLLVFGEIDCRIHVYGQYMKRNAAVPMEVLMDEIITRYGAVMDEISAKGIRFAVLGPPPATRQGNRYGKSVYATPDTHRFIYSEFNRRLEAYCRLKQYPFIDVQSYVADAEGFTQPRFAADDVHLNRKAATWVRQRVAELYSPQ